MKEFDKWWKEASKDDRRYGPEDNYVAKDGWKAALKWVLEQETWIGSDDDGEWGIDKDKIKEELNAKT